MQSRQEILESGTDSLAGICCTAQRRVCPPATLQNHTVCPFRRRQSIANPADWRRVSHQASCDTSVLGQQSIPCHFSPSNARPATSWFGSRPSRQFPAQQRFLPCTASRGSNHRLACRHSLHSAGSQKVECQCARTDAVRIPARRARHETSPGLCMAHASLRDRPGPASKCCDVYTATTRSPRADFLATPATGCWHIQ